MPGDSTQLVREDKPQTQDPAQLAKIYFFSSLFQGVATTGIFSPMDRALFLSQIHNRPFFSWANFTSPYQGCPQAMLVRCLTGSTYYIAQEEGHRWLFPKLTQELNFNQQAATLSIGLFAGTLNGLVRQPTDAVKYLAWGHPNAKLIPTAREMWKYRQASPFLCGMPSTIGRDSAFGIVYEMTRFGLLEFQKKYHSPVTEKKEGQFLTLDFIHNSLSALFATVIASPLNYTRNMQLHSLQLMMDKKIPEQPTPTAKTLLYALNQESKLNRDKGFNRASFFAKRLNLGAGTLRSGLSMAVGQYIFGELKEKFSNLTQSEPARPKIK